MNSLGIGLLRNRGVSLSLDCELVREGQITLRLADFQRRYWSAGCLRSHSSTGCELGWEKMPLEKTRGAMQQLTGGEAGKLLV